MLKKNQTINIQRQTLEARNNSNTKRIVLEQSKLHIVITDIKHNETKDNLHYVIRD